MASSRLTLQWASIQRSACKFVDEVQVFQFGCCFSDVVDFLHYIINDLTSK